MKYIFLLILLSITFGCSSSVEQGILQEQQVDFCVLHQDTVHYYPVPVLECYSNEKVVYTDLDQDNLATGLNTTEVLVQARKMNVPVQCTSVQNVATSPNCVANEQCEPSGEVINVSCESFTIWNATSEILMQN